ncbi:MAG: sulfotransferase family 2 domain-containing protein [Paracoccaceae bacterium]
MILSHGRKYLFIHQPKTGGTSMALALEQRAMKDDIMLGNTPKAMKRRRRLQDMKTRGRLWKHSTLQDIDGLVTPNELNDLFVFSLVRNPWDRMVSYYHWLREQSFAHAAVALARSLEFEQFAMHPQTCAALKASPARHYLTDITGQERADLFIRIEYLNDDAQMLWEHLGFELEIPHTNKSARRNDFRSYYSPDSQMAVAKAAAEDISRFGYSFER